MRPTRLTAPLLVLAALAAPAHAQTPAPCTPAYTLPSAPTPQPPIDTASNTPVAITITPAFTRIGGCSFARNLYQVQGHPAAYVPPTLYIDPGALLTLSVNNQMSTQVDTTYHSTVTNFHFHGFNVTPGRRGGSSNAGDQVVTVSYPFGTTHAYQFSLPNEHPVGMHWYHPHPHEFTDEQVAGGMSGAILVGDVAAQRLPGNANIPQKVLLLKDFQPQGPNGNAAAVFTVNGDWPALFTLQAGTAQLWHIGNVGADTYAGVALLDSGTVSAAGKLTGTGVDSAYVVGALGGSTPGLLPFIVLGMDGNGLLVPDTAGSLTLSPAVRYSAVVQAPASAKTYLMVNTVSSGAVNGGVGDILGIVRVTGSGAPPSPIAIAPDTTAQRKIGELLAANVTQADTFTFSSSATSPTFFINGQTYDHGRIDVYVRQGATQDWTLVNADTAAAVLSPHVFHIHQGDFLVTSVNGSAVPANVLQDRLSIAPGDTMVVRIPFTEEFQTGIYVFHCHILFHEDHGMMKNVCVYPSYLEGDAGKTWCDAQLASSGS